MMHKEAPRGGARCAIPGGVPRPFALCALSQVLNVCQAMRRDASVGLENHGDDPRAFDPQGVIVVAPLFLHPTSARVVIEGPVPHPAPGLAAKDLEPEGFLRIPKGVVVSHCRRLPSVGGRPEPLGRRLLVGVPDFELKQVISTRVLVAPHFEQIHSMSLIEIRSLLRVFLVPFPNLADGHRRQHVVPAVERPIVALVLVTAVDEEMYSSELFVKHSTAVVSTVTAAVGLLERGDMETLVTVLQDLGERHGAFDLGQEHYDLVGSSLLYTLGLGLGDAFTTDMEKAWVGVYAIITEQMMVGAKEYSR